ncbi:hypothetical protein Misp01_03480 [Microtetraspora sp. NBRC 13810]|uniref:hypothetical protein n=1 Tax=Microtetraspora sp. NBRC 13810 TaxID=3030990 RepID=UPI0024A1B4C2|nr:hypothetical protein [Microtetraspora sp. NBRC 13810]GLW05218.1 hypothetical protein Misp01_03480 [Microtetraspora sp. NBRC 13810]
MNTIISPTPASGLTRRRLTVFALVLPVLVLSAVAVAVSQGADVNRLEQSPPAAQIALFGQAFMPAVAGLVAWAAGGRGLRGFDWGFHRAPWRLVAGAWTLGVLVPLLQVGTRVRGTGG